MKTKDINTILENTISSEIRKAILQESKDYYHVMDNNQPIETFETYDEAKKFVDTHTGKELIIDKKKYGSYDEMIDDLDEMSEDINENIKTKKMKKNLKENMSEFDEDWTESEMYEDDSLEMSPHDKFMGQEPDYSEMSEMDVMDFDTEEEPTQSSPNVETLIDKYLVNEPEEDLSEEGMCMECGDNYMEEISEDWGSSDINQMNQSIHKELGNPDRMPSPFDERFNDVVESAVDFYWSDWEEYETDRESLVLKAKKDYLRRMFSEEYNNLMKMFEPAEESDIDESDTYEGAGMCSECGSMLNEEGMCMECGMKLNESKKRKLRLKESELVSIIKQMVMETIPGLTVTNKSREGSKKETNKYYGEVDSKMKEYRKFKGNDNPEFPHQVGTGEKMARENTPEQEDEVARNFAGLQNLEYDVEPSDRFKERLKMAIEGHSHMGNATETPKPSIKPSNDAPKGNEAKEKSGNQIKTETPKKIEKQVKNRKKDMENRKLYKKEIVPVNTSKKEDKSLNESKLPKGVIDEIQKMKKLSSYNKRTQ